MYLQITKTCIKACLSSYNGQTGPLTTDSCNDPSSKTILFCYNGKMLSPYQFTAFIFNRTSFKVADSEDWHSSSVHFHFWPNHT